MTFDEMELIDLAISYVKSHHGTQKRASGEPFYSHPLEVAGIVADYYMEVAPIVSAILHDSVEDTEQFLSFYEFVFGKEVAQIIASLTSLNDNIQKLKLSNASTYEKLWNTGNEGRRVLIIKLVDRLHNMRTIEYKPILKQKTIAEETLKIYLPMAKHVKAYEIGEELKYLSLKILTS